MRLLTTAHPKDETTRMFNTLPACHWGRTFGLNVPEDYLFIMHLLPAFARQSHRAARQSLECAPR